MKTWDELEQELDALQARFEQLCQSAENPGDMENCPESNKFAGDLSLPATRKFWRQ